MIMETTATPENAFPFICSNEDCSKSYDIKAFADVYTLWGYIFLVSGNKCILGFTCPECNCTTIKRFSAIPDDFSAFEIERLSREGQDNAYNTQSPMYFTKFSTSLLPKSESAPDVDDAGDNNYSIPPYLLPIRYIPAFEQIKTDIDGNRIDELMTIENEQNLKVFSRIVPFNSVYRLSDAWIQEDDGELTEDILEECDTSLSILYKQGHNHQLGINQGQPQKPYMNLIKSDMSDDEYQNMDQDLYAWDTEKFHNGIGSLLNEYKTLRNKKNFELVCYDELINKYARKFYYDPQLIQERQFEKDEFAKGMPESVPQEPTNDTTNEYYEEEIQGPPVPALDPQANIIAQLNQRHAVVDYSGQTLIMNEEYDPSLERPYISLSKKTDFFDKYANQLLPDPSNTKKDISIAQYWWTHKDRKTYKGIVFEPGKNLPGYYNLWTGFSFQPVPGDWSLFRNHIFNIVANGNEKIFEWIMGWMARIVQDPGGEKPGTAIVLRGGQGTGKTFFARIFGKLFGRHYLYISHPGQLTGQFNHHLKDALVVFVDEGFLVGDKKAEGFLKSMVTEKVINIEQKFRDMTTVKNHINLIIASNNKQIVPAGMDERRFFVLDISEGQKQNKAYFKAVEDQMNNGGYEAMLYDLQRWEYNSCH